MKTSERFPSRIYVRNDLDSHGLLVVGCDDDLAHLDADDGQSVAIYERAEVRIYRTMPRLDPVRPTKKR